MPYKVRISDRYDHMHIIGTTGKGKSKLLERMIYQDTIARRTQKDFFEYLDEFQLFVFKQRKATLIKTIEVLDQGFNRNSLNRIKKESARNFGRDYREVMKETRERYLNNKENNIKKFEET